METHDYKDRRKRENARLPGQIHRADQDMNAGIRCDAKQDGQRELACPLRPAPARLSERDGDEPHEQYNTNGRERKIQIS